MRSKAMYHISLLAICAVAALSASLAVSQPNSPDDLLKQADQQFEKGNYLDAATSYARLLEQAPRHDKWEHASQRIITSYLRLQRFDDAIDAATSHIDRCKNTYLEPRAERLLGNLYLTLPHWGTRSGGTFHRGQWKQGIYLVTYNHDKGKAIGHLERARELYAKWDVKPEGRDPMPEAVRKNWHDERIECSFDLAGAAARFGIYENSGYFWHRFWAERDDTIAETAGEQDFDEYHSQWEWQRKRPIGLRLNEEGEPIFPVQPKDYSTTLNDDQKILYLLAEARELDETENKRHTALSYYRQGMLARSRWGMDRLNTYAHSYYYGGTNPLKKQFDELNPWELKDDQALVLAGGELRIVDLPKQWNILGLLRTVEGDYRKSGIAGQAKYAIGVYHQSRQQYKTALRVYNELKVDFAGEGDLVANANQQIQKIKAPQVFISQTGVQLPDQPAEVQVSYRNLSNVHFVVRKIDPEGFIRAIREREFDKKRYWHYSSAISRWHQYFMGYSNDQYNKWLYDTAVKHTGEEVLRWTAEVKDDGTHRYARATLPAPLSDRGNYLIYAYTEKPADGDATIKDKRVLTLGQSRAVFSLSDVAIVEKQVEDGHLYFISDAQSGRPVADADVDVFEWWWTYEKREQSFHKKIHKLKTDKDGFAVVPQPEQDGRTHYLHALVEKGERFAWSGMQYHNRYHPSHMRSGRFAYCITDRPVYRPNQTVHLKVWTRMMDDGVLENTPNRQYSVRIHDPRGNKVHEFSARTDEYGGISGEYVLPEEPPLGRYYVYISNQNHVGGTQFRVEEYKKPEFEVTVEPGATHAKLGQKVTADIKATYYFGAPVANGTVKYKLFREEYRHSYYFPGEWDWLYGAGYGWPWYSYEWFDWWRARRCCWMPPAWWWGGGSHYQPVRELVAQGEGELSEDGTYKVEIDTTDAKKHHGDLDHRYVVQAEVRDASRRVITGEGAVKVTRQAYYAFLQSDKGYYTPGQEMLVRVRCLTPDNKPVETEGVMTVSEVVFGGPDNATISEKQVDTWKIKTDERGLAEFRLRHEKSGQLKFKFEAPDTWGGMVEGYSVVWVAGRDFEGKLYRFNDLEIITDKRTYQPGDTAHVMINTKKSESYVLFADEVDANRMISYKLLHLPQRHTVVDIPITKHHKPNFFIEATTVADVRTHQQHMQICVPPEDAVAKVTVTTDKEEYEPGEEATVTVTAVNPDGTPARAQVVLSAFDRSVLYIAPETTPEIAKFFHGNLRHHYPAQHTNLVEQLSSTGYVTRPFQQLYPYPPAWWGVWGPQASDWRTVVDDQVRSMSGAMIEADEVGGEARRERAAGEKLMAQRPASNAAPAGRGAAAGGLAMDRSSLAKTAELKRDSREDQDGQAGGSDVVEAEVRTNFADTALWLPAIVTNDDGVATHAFTMPDNLTTWKINAWAIDRKSRVGQATSSAVTTKNLLVRLQAPRFFMERDEVVISGIVHNYLESAKKVEVSLGLHNNSLQFMGDLKTEEVSAETDDRTGTWHTRTVEVPANGEKRIDWRIKVVKEGMAKITLKGLTDEESDAMRMSFPVLVHGMMKQVATTGSMRPDEHARTIEVQLDVPEQRKPELTVLEVQYAPSLVGSMLDALPYCIDYPYGCTEQTMSRFVPAVMTLKTMQNMGIKLEDVQNIRGRMEEIRRTEKGEGFTLWTYAQSPVFNTEYMNEVIAKSLRRIASMQNGDGGWGWWKDEQSSPYLTSYVCYSLSMAAESDIAVDQNMHQRGLNWLQNWENNWLGDPLWNVSEARAYSAYVLSLKKMQAKIKPAEDDKRPGELIERLWEGRDKLNVYGKSLLSLALAHLGDKQRAETVLENILQYKIENKETQVAHMRTPNQGWWYWWNNDIETNAWALRALIKLRPDSDIAPRMVKWLLNNRRNGYYWGSTRDTAMCVAAMSEFVVASGEGKPDFTLTLDLDDGDVVKKIKINKDNFFTFDNKFIIEGAALTGGKHTLKVTKNGPGALYFNTYLRYFTKEENISAAGHELKVDRQYFRLEQIPFEVEVEDAEGNKITERRLRYERIPVKTGDTVESGDIMQVELKVTADNDYTFLCLEDMKPAGFEPTQLRSGGKGQEGFYSYMELRDEKTVFFMSLIGEGDHLLRYRLRAEIPGEFHALPTKFYAMYVPELKSNSNEHIIRIVD